MKLYRFDYSVKWSNFSNIENRPAGAEKDASIEMETAHFIYDWTEEKGEYRIKNATATSSVIKNITWVVESAKTKELLRHKQGYYDMFAINIREMLVKLE